MKLRKTTGAGSNRRIQAGFRVETSTSHLSAKREIVLNGEESPKELGKATAEILGRIFK